LELDRDVLLEHYATIVPNVLDCLIPEERHRLHKMLQITKIVQPDTTLQPFSKRVNLSEKVALSIQSVQRALYPVRLNQWDHPL
jgi:hypothetical protein